MSLVDSQKVLEAVAKSLEFRVKDLTLDMRMGRDLGADSLQLCDLEMHLEDTFKLKDITIDFSDNIEQIKLSIESQLRGQSKLGS